jgi:endonuclease/exonuclease/phosphatase family metal-dependent hydrolase
MRALTWNLYHGRAREPAGRPLLAEFCAALAGWEWDVALLQEVPPWWPPGLAAASRAPDLLGANGGGANAILARVTVFEHRTHRLTWWPERRWAQAVRLDGGWVVNLHASTHRPAWALRDTLRALEWAPRPVLVFGGDLNLRSVSLPGLRHVAGHHVDHLFSDGRPGVAEVLDRGELSDHPPVRVTL